jgi:hypothetical protein
MTFEIVRCNTHTKSFIQLLSRLLLLGCGFLYIKETKLKCSIHSGREMSKRIIPHIIVSNHTGMYDIPIVTALFDSPAFISKLAVLHLPFVGSIASALQCIFIDRNDPLSRSSALKVCIYNIYIIYIYIYIYIYT